VIEIPNRSKIINSTFETNDDCIFTDTIRHIVLRAAKRINIYGNTFENNSTDGSLFNNGYGIDASESTINVTNQLSPAYEVSPNYFNNLFYGIHTTNGINAGNHRIKGSVFDGCYRSVYLNSSESAKITNNTITVADFESGLFGYGIYVDGGTGFKVENNDISSSSAASGLLGIIVNNTGPVNNEIYNNILNDLNVGINAQKVNRNLAFGSTDVGLRLLCNDMDNPNSYDIAVTNWNSQGSLYGLAKDQRMPSDDPNIDHLPAANKFTVNSRAYDYDFSNADAASLLYYYDNTNPSYKAMPTHLSNINLEGMNLPNTCPDKNTVSSLSTLYSNLGNAQVLLNSSQTMLNIWQDGGDANLDQQIETIDPWDVYIEFNSLIAESPYLSEDALVAIIENEAFTSLMVKLLMIANPHSSRSDFVMEALYNRLPPMPESYMEEIMAEEQTISQLDLLKNDVATNYHLLRTIGEDIKRFYRNDTINEWAIDSLINFTSRQTDLIDKYELATIYLEHGLYEDMDNLINAIDDDFELSEDEQTDYAHFINLYDIAADLRMNGLSEEGLSESQIGQLNNALETDRPKVSQMAVSLLKYNDMYFSVDEDVIMPNSEPPAMAPPNNNQQNSNQQIAEFEIKLYPNPAIDYLTIQYLTSEMDYKKLRLKVYDSKSKLIINKDLQGGDNDELINISSLESGMYNIHIYADDKLLEIFKITVLD